MRFPFEAFTTPGSKHRKFSSGKGSMQFKMKSKVTCVIGSREKSQEPELYRDILLWEQSDKI